MAKRLILAEKPSVARDLARALKLRAPSGGGVYEDDRYVITWCIGHLVELCEPHEYDEAWKRWQMATLPMLPGGFKLRPVRSSMRQWRVVKEQLRRRDLTSVINACDAGREGELIFRFCYELAGCRLPVERLWISSLTEQAIGRGFAELRPGRELEPLYAAARCRAEADWLVGMNATRAVTLWRRHGSSEKGVLYSLGRVQTPTLGLLVGREQAIQRFVPRDYFEVHAELRTTKPDGERGSGARFTAVWQSPAPPRARTGDAAQVPGPGPGPGNDSSDGGERDLRRLARRELADALVERDRPAPVCVERVDKKAVREPPPLLFDLGSLQRTANRRFGWTAQRTLSLAQALYEEHKLLTYPRTDSRYLSRDLIGQLPRTFAALGALPAYRAFAEQAERAAPPRRVFQDHKVTDHHAIIPTLTAQTPERLAALSSDERALLDLVSRRFLGAFFPDAEFEQTQVVVRVDAAAGAPVAPVAELAAGPGEEGFVTVLPPPPDRYHARGRVRTRAGWQEVAGIDEKKASRGAGPAGAHEGDGATDTDGEADDEAMQPLPPLTAGQALSASFAVQAKQTRPPPRYTEATLLQAMESAGRQLTDEALRLAMKDQGLGTPATRASIIETLVDRGYLQRQGKQLLPTVLGIDLIEKLPQRSLTSAQLTGEWEARLSRMARGEDARTAFMADIARFVRELVDAVRAAPAPAAVQPAVAAPSGRRGAPRSRARSAGAATPGAAASAPAARRTRSPRRAPTESTTAAPAAKARTRKAATEAAGSRTPSRRRTAAAPPLPVSRPAVSPPPPTVSPPPRAAAPSRPTPGTPVEPAIRCPRCGAGRILWGRRAWGCSNFRACQLVVSFETESSVRGLSELRAELAREGAATASR
ncbi:MAG: DNA topoisomerase [Polyangia bacterium]